MDRIISVIIPAYNIAPWIRRCLDSVLAQTHQNLEVIAVNDGSTDDTAAILDNYAAKDCRMKVIHKENGGVTSARLRGVAEATGQWIGFVDGDDYVEPDMYERLLKNALEADADISHCGYRMILPSGRVDHYYNTGNKVEQNCLQGLQDLLEGRFVEPGLWNKLYKKELFAQLEEKMDSRIRINEDLLMNYYLFAKADKAIFEDFCPYHYMVRNGSAASAPINEHKLMDPIRVTYQIMEQAPRELDIVLQAKLARQLIMLASMPVKESPDWMRHCLIWGRTELKDRLPQLLSADISAKWKVLTLWAAVWPGSYGWVHRTYSKISGKDKRYQ